MGRPRTARTAARAGAAASKKSGKDAVPSTAPSPADFTALLSSLTHLLSSPTAFLSPSPALRSSLLSQLQSLYAQQFSTSAATQLLPPSALLSILPSLLTTGFTVDQIYEQWQLLQRPLTQRIKQTVGDIVQQSAALMDEQKEGQEEEEGEDGLGDEDVDGEDEELEGEDDAADDLDDEDAEMEARLDAMQHDGEDEEEEEGDEEEEKEGQDEEEQNEDEDEDNDEKQEEPNMKRKPQIINKQPKRTTTTASASRDVSEDAFFSLNQMERFADHYEDIDTPHDDNSNEHKQQQGTDDAVDDGEEWDDEVDLDADVGEVELNGGERYDDFFDPPTEAELKGQSISDMHRQEDQEDGEGEAEGEEEEEEGGEEGALEMDGEDEGAAATEGDEFGGFFARLASHHRAQHKKQPPPPPSTEPPSDPTTTAPAAPLSHFAQQQQALASTLQQLEQQLITPKPWYHRGEVSAMERPSDSLLTTDLQVDSNVKQREVMTRAINESIEEIIRRRVSEGRYDDPVKRTALKAKPYRVKDSTEVSSEKSTQGLAALYEQQFMEEKAREDAAATGAAAADDTAKPHKSKQQQERDKQVTEIRTLFASLVADLSALSQYSYVPAERSEVRIVRDRDDSDVLAAEEVGIDFESGVREGRSVKEVMRGKRSGEMVGEGEREQVERKRRRRQMKERGQKRKREQVVEDRNKQLSAGVNGIGTRRVLSQDEVKKAMSAANVKKGTAGGAAGGGKSGGGLNKSGKFFSQLQQNVAAVEADARREGMLK